MASSYSSLAATKATTGQGTTNPAYRTEISKVLEDPDWPDFFPFDAKEAFRRYDGERKKKEREALLIPPPDSHSLSILLIFCNL